MAISSKIMSKSFNFCVHLPDCAKVGATFSKEWTSESIVEKISILSEFGAFLVI